VKAPMYFTPASNQFGDGAASVRVVALRLTCVSLSVLGYEKPAVSRLRQLVLFSCRNLG
jgi:hypothetical protein